MARREVTMPIYPMMEGQKILGTICNSYHWHPFVARELVVWLLLLHGSRVARTKATTVDSSYRQIAHWYKKRPRSSSAEQVKLEA